MIEEKEIKLHINGVTDAWYIKEHLQDFFGILFDNDASDEDIYFDYPDKFFFSRNHGVRIRKSAQRAEIAYKALFYLPYRLSNPWFVLEKETSFPISIADMTGLLTLANIEFDFGLLKDGMELDYVVSLLEQFGLYKDIIIIKKRSSAANGKYNFHLDQVKELGVFLEIEAVNDSDPYDLLHKFPFEYKQIRYGYPKLYAVNVLGYPEDTKLTKKFIDSPDWNYLDGQKEIVSKLLS